MVTGGTGPPLLFLSGVFISLGINPPAWMAWVGRIFAVRHLLSQPYPGLPRFGGIPPRSRVSAADAFLTGRGLA
ncbi:MAG TPA: hypothetical protein VNW50_00860 [Streptosporangiaceae bacterium]|nr:hypothetical protein [Streptosporangiaceae bacterium]